MKCLFTIFFWDRYLSLLTVKAIQKDHGNPRVTRIQNQSSLSKNIEITHSSLFDNCVEGIKLKNKPIFSVQYHPESNPGPQDSIYLFEEFVKEMKKNAKKKRS